jgi:hypothetical protein
MAGRQVARPLMPMIEAASLSAVRAADANGAVRRERKAVSCSSFSGGKPAILLGTANSSDLT